MKVAGPSGRLPLGSGCLPLDMYGCIAEHIDNAHDVLALLSTSSLLRRKVVVRLRWSYIRESDAKMYARIRRYTVLRRFYYCFRCHETESESQSQSASSARARADVDALALMTTMSCADEVYAHAASKCLPLALAHTAARRGIEFIAAANGISLLTNGLHDRASIYIGILRHAVMHADMRMLRSTSLYVPVTDAFDLSDYQWAVYDAWSARSQHNASKYSAFLCELLDWSEGQPEQNVEIIKRDVLLLGIILDLVDVVRHVMPSCALIARQSSMIAIAWRAQTDAYRYLVASGHVPCMSAIADTQSQWALAAWKPADLFHHQPLGHPTHPCFYANILSWLNSAPNADVMTAAVPILNARVQYDERLVWQLPDDICIRVISYIAGVSHLLKIIGHRNVTISLAVYKYLEQRQWTNHEVLRWLFHKNQSYALLCYLAEKYAEAGRLSQADIQSLMCRATSPPEADFVLLRLLLRYAERSRVIAYVTEGMWYAISTDALRIIFESLGVEYERREEFYDHHVGDASLSLQARYLPVSSKSYAILMRHAPRLARRFTEAYKVHGYAREEEEEEEEQRKGQGKEESSRAPLVFIIV